MECTAENSTLEIVEIDRTLLGHILMPETGLPRLIYPYFDCHASVEQVR